MQYADKVTKLLMFVVGGVRKLSSVNNFKIIFPAFLLIEIFLWNHAMVSNFKFLVHDLHYIPEELICNHGVYGQTTYNTVVKEQLSMSEVDCVNTGFCGSSPSYLYTTTLHANQIAVCVCT